MTEGSTVATARIGDLVSFSPERRVREMVVRTDRIVSELVCYEGGQGTKQHVHPHQDEIFVCLEGEGAITFADPERDDEMMGQGSVVMVPAGIRHGVSTEPGKRFVLMFTKGPGLPNPNRRRAP